MTLGYKNNYFDCGEVGDLWRYDPKHASALEEADDSPDML
jgi:hypothetical protein